MSYNGIRLRHLVFTGPGLEPAGMKFADGLNIVFGASDTGKSFIVKAISFMIGATKKLPKVDESEGYDSGWLGLTLPDGSEVTLYRATKGGSLRLHAGLATDATGDPGRPLGVTESKNIVTISHYLLRLIGLSDKLIIKNKNADKDRLTIRLLAPLVLIEEDSIMAARSPVLYSKQYTSETLEKNLFRLILTGQDDAAVVAVTGKKTRNVVTTAKLAIIDELISGIDRELGEGLGDRSSVLQQSEATESSLRSLHEMLAGTQTEIDVLVFERRTWVDRKLELSGRLAELDVTLQRFASLNAIYQSDIDRLQALEESGFLLSAMTGQDCAVCGAPPSEQRHQHAAEEIEKSHRAAAAEARKIEWEKRDLSRTVASLTAEANGLRTTLDGIESSIAAVEGRLAESRPKEAGARADFEALFSKKNDLDRILSLFSRRDKLVVKRSQVSDWPSSEKSRNNVSVGIAGPTAFAFGQTVREVLEAWHFPRAAEAQFDLQTNDVTIGGKARADSGKGVRAILHAAVNVALLIFCRDKGLPHPGFVVLDTPLLTYREPLTSKHGELSPDEEAIGRTRLATHFYNHLTSLEKIGQFIVLENATPPSNLAEAPKVEIFTARDGVGRYGLFPKKSS